METCVKSRVHLFLPIVVRICLKCNDLPLFADVLMSTCSSEIYLFIGKRNCIFAVFFVRTKKSAYEYTCQHLCFVLCVLSAGCILYIGDEMEMLRALLESSCVTGIVVLPCYFEWKMKGFLTYGFCLAVLLCLYCVWVKELVFGKSVLYAVVITVLVCVFQFMQQRFLSPFIKDRLKGKGYGIPRKKWW